ncbi:UNVERIFIED_CONTAM: hypothetical protein NCL1_12645 [Trichonephila clavipes]
MKMALGSHATFDKQLFIICFLPNKIGNRLRIFTLPLTGGAHRYHCSRRKQKPTSDINKALTGGAQRTSLNQSPGDQSRGFSTADSLWLGTRACAVLAISLRCQSMFRYFHCKARDPHVEAWRVGCHLSRPPRHLTEVPNHTVYERRVRYTNCCLIDFICCGMLPNALGDVTSDYHIRLVANTVESELIVEIEKKKKC